MGGAVGLKRYIVPEAKLRQLIYDSLMLDALLSGGVDNWPGYSDAIQDRLNEAGNPENGLWDVVDVLILYEYFQARSEDIYDQDYKT